MKGLFQCPPLRLRYFSGKPCTIRHGTVWQARNKISAWQAADVWFKKNECYEQKQLHTDGKIPGNSLRERITVHECRTQPYPHIQGRQEIFWLLSVADETFRLPRLAPADLSLCRERWQDMGDGTWKHYPETGGITAISIPMYEGEQLHAARLGQHSRMGGLFIGIRHWGRPLHFPNPGAVPQPKHTHLNIEAFSR